MAVKFNTRNALTKFKSLGGETAFPDSLKDVLNRIQNDKNISTVEQASYLLATAKVESDYSLQRWESDYLCGAKGVPYKDKPCQKAIDYYRSSATARWRRLGNAVASVTPLGRARSTGGRRE